MNANTRRFGHVCRIFLRKVNSWTGMVALCIAITPAAVLLVPGPSGERPHNARNVCSNPALYMHGGAPQQRDACLRQK